MSEPEKRTSLQALIEERDLYKDCLSTIGHILGNKLLSVEMKQHLIGEQLVIAACSKAKAP